MLHGRVAVLWALKTANFLLFTAFSWTLFLNTLVQNLNRGLHKDTLINSNQKKVFCGQMVLLWALKSVNLPVFFTAGTWTLFINPLVQNFNRGLHKDNLTNSNQKKVLHGRVALLGALSYFNVFKGSSSDTGLPVPVNRTDFFLCFLGRTISVPANISKQLGRLCHNFI